MVDEIDRSIEIRALEEIVNSSPEGLARFGLAHEQEDHPNWGYDEWFKWACWFIDESKKELEELKKRTDKSVSALASLGFSLARIASPSQARRLCSQCGQGALALANGIDRFLKQGRGRPCHTKAGMNPRRKSARSTIKEEKK